MLFSNKIRVGVLRGGPSPEYKFSLETGKSVLNNLFEELYTPVDIFISRDGVWHEGGVAREPDKILKKVDVVWNALHGTYGEDGTVQKILEGLGMPYTGATSLPSALGMNKIVAKKIYNNNGLKTPYAVFIPNDALSKQTIREVYESIPAPFIVKPASAGSTIGVHIVHALSDLEEAIVEASTYSPTVLIEEFINGREATCGVVEGFRDREHYTLLPVETRGGEYIVPGNFSKEEMWRIGEMAEKAHQVLGLRHYSNSDFIVHPKRGVFILETNSLPKLAQDSKIHRALSATGSNISEFIDHIIKLAIK
jgi:D-alanine-D-alanine ligase